MMKTRILALHGKLNLLLQRYVRDQRVSSVKKQLLCQSKQIYNATTNNFTQRLKMDLPLTAIRITISELKNEDDIIKQILC